ncbi:MAG: hypothetical protein ACQETA_05710, partial [Bacteroidota bacterium]
MNIKRLILLFLLLTGFLYGCKTTGLIEPAAEEEEAIEPVFEIKEYSLPSVLWQGDDEATRTNISEAALAAAGKGCNSLFIKAAELTATGFDPLEYAIEEAHENDLKLFVLIKLPDFRESLQNMPFHELKQSTREQAGTYVLNYNIDGLGFELPEDSGQPGTITDAALYDLLEDVMAWAMLRKPYLMSAVRDGKDETRMVNSAPDGGEKVRTTSEWPINISPRQVVGLDFSSYFPGPAAGREIYLEDEGRTKICSSDGFIGIIAPVNDTIRLRSSEGEIKLSTQGWNVPYDYSVLPDNTVARQQPWLEFRRMPAAYTNNPDYDLLCKTDYPARVSIEGEEVKQYKTGIFFKSISLEEGPNRIRATVVSDDSLSTFYEQEYFYEKTDNKRKAFPLWIDARSLEPAHDLEILPDDVVRIGFTGSLGQVAYMRIHPGEHIFRCSREDFEDYSLYRADVPVNKFRPGERYSLSLQLQPLTEQQWHEPYELETGRYFMVREPEDFPLVMVKNENTRVT